MSETQQSVGPKWFSKKAALVTVCLILLLALAYFVDSSSAPSRITNWGVGWIPAMSLAELGKSPPFVAVVESKKHGEWGTPLDSTTGKPSPGAKPTEYVTVYLRKADGTITGICQQNPTVDEIAFVSHLREGEKYSFPTILTNWK